MNLKNFIKLDIKSVSALISVKGLIISCVAFLIMPIFIEFQTKFPFPFSIIIFTVELFTVCGVVIESPFGIEMKNNINQFYITQNIPRKTVVYGRYLSTLFVNFIITLAVFIIQVIVLIAFGRISDTKIEIIAAAILFITIFLCAELFAVLSNPIYFALGILKGRYINSAILMIIFLVPVLIYFLSGVQESKNPFQDFPPETILMTFVYAGLIALGALVLLTFLSVYLSVKFYAKREF
jgi:hypothetical protein